MVVIHLRGSSASAEALGYDMPCVFADFETFSNRKVDAMKLWATQVSTFNFVNVHIPMRMMNCAVNTVNACTGAEGEI